MFNPRVSDFTTKTFPILVVIPVSDVRPDSYSVSASFNKHAACGGGMRSMCNEWEQQLTTRNIMRLMCVYDVWASKDMI